VTSSSAFIEATFKSDGNGGSVWDYSFPVDSDTQLTVVLISPYLSDLQINVHEPSWSRGYSLNLASGPRVDKRSGPWGIDGDSYPSDAYVITNPTVGLWNVEIKIAKVIPYDKPQAAVIIGNESPYQVFAHVNTHELHQGQEVGLVASLTDATNLQLLSGKRPMPLTTAKLVPQMEVIFPNGKEVVLDMHDDGFHLDLEAGDGIFGAVLSASQAGAYQAQAIFNGVTPQGRPFLRTTEHLFSVAQPELTLTGLSSAEVKSDNFVYFYVDVDLLSGAVQRAEASGEGLTVKAYAEVWGTDSTGLEYVPVGWVQGMVDPQRDAEGEHYISLQIHSDWVHKAGAQPPFQLRNAWLEDRSSNVILSNRDVIYVEEESASLRYKFNPVRRPLNAARLPVTEEMKVGPRPASMRNVTTAKRAGGKVVLVHGYCSGANEFPTSQFPDSVQFQDYKQSRSNDDFALRIKALGDQYPSFSIVAHSQGGLAATHLHAYYWSNLETKKDSDTCRLIQSVGSPYHGSGLAGGLAGIGDWFGVGCGSNTDLSYDGAENWVSAVPVDAQKDVYYYTTQYGDDGYCVWGANMVLYKPNDGTTEIKKAALVGGNAQKTIIDWCHTSEMIYPAQCTDPARNAEMSQFACR